MNRIPYMTGAKSVLAALILLTSIPGTAAAQSAPLPAAPQSAPPADAAAAKPAKSPPPGADARRGIVTVEQGGRTLGIGTVLGGDGRILTALSALRGAEQADVRYADGRTVRARLGHRDPLWDLALLIPLSGKWTDGLTASEADPTNAELKVFLAGGRTAAVSSRVKTRVDAKAKDGGSLSNALDLELRGTPIVGAPVIDATGGVVAVLVRACKPSDGAVCLMTIYGAPVAAIRSFLVSTPLNAVSPSPWLGIVGAPDTVGNTRGVRVMAVAPSSPAAKAGLKTNSDQTQAHLIVAVDGNPVDTPEKLADRISKRAVGETVKLLVLESEKFKDVSVVLRSPP